MKRFENELYKKGFSKIAGLDESGRGCLAGPLVVAICVFDREYKNEEIKDSKKINKTKREQIFEIIKKNALLLDWVIFDANFVDQNNPKQTSKIGMTFLINKHKKFIDYALVDAENIKSKIPVMSIIKGDDKSQSIAGASIVAKVIRDHIMNELDIKFPQYDFKNNKGYGTKKHLDAIRKFGPLKKIHRYSYKPIKPFCNRN